MLARTYRGSFRTELLAGTHRLVADEPAGVGGTDLGPSPYGLLSAALASCTSMTLTMYARHKKLDLQATTVRVRHRKVRAEDCADCNADAGYVDEFRREIELEGNLSEAQQQRLMEVADKCPVHKTLHNEVNVRTTLA